MPDDLIYESLGAGAAGVQVNDDLIPSDITRDTELAAHAAEPNAHHAPPLDTAQVKKTLEVNSAFRDGGWAGSRTAQVSDSIKVGNTAYTASEITGLTYVAFRTQPSPNALPGHIAVRILLADKPKVAQGKLRTTEGNRTEIEPYDPNILLTDAMHVTDSGDYAYYSVYDADGFVSDDATWVQELDPFELDPAYVPRRDNDVFDAQAWTASTNNLLGATSSTTPYTLHNNNIRTVSAYGNAHAVGATTNGFYVAVRIPVADANADALQHYRLTSSRDSSVKAITAGEFVVNSTDGTYALYNIFFPAGAATTIAMQEREDHLFNPRKGTINFPQLADTPAAIEAGKLLVGNAAGDALEFDELEAGSSAVTINGLTIDVDQTAFDILQLGQAQNSANQVFLTSATGVPTRTTLPGGAFNIHENNLIVVEWAYGDIRGSRTVQSAILRRLASIAAKTGSEATGDDFYPIEIGYDGLGNRRQLRLYRSSDNELILGGALIRNDEALLTEAGVSPTRAFQATVSLYEIGGNAGAAGRQQQIASLAPRYWSGYIETAVGTTPNLPIGFDGAVWTGVDSWSRDPLPGAPAAGRTRWFGSAEAYHTPGATFNWTIQSRAVRPLADIRFSSVPNARTPADVTSAPTAASRYWNAYAAGDGWSRYWYPLLSNPDWRYLDAVDWWPNAANSTAAIDFPEWDTATHAGFALIVEVYNAGGHDVSEVLQFLVEPLPAINVAARGTVTLAHNNAIDMTWQRRVEGPVWEWTDFNPPGGIAQNNYGRFGASAQLQHTSGSGTRVDRVALATPAVYSTSRSIRWRVSLWVRSQ